MTRHAVVYLPIEFGSREFDGKALLAATLVKRGYGVVIGEQWTIYTNLAKLPTGAVLFKSFNHLHVPAMREAKDFGHLAFALEEELLAHTQRKTMEYFFQVPGALELPDTVATSGTFEKEALSDFSGGRARIEVTGNLRVDVLKPAFRGFFQREIDALRARFGDFVLVNTNFAATNSVWETMEEVEKIQIDAGSLRLDDPASVASWRDRVAFERMNKEAILTAIRELARRRPQQRIVLRPHPAEALARWDGLFADLSNVTVVREGAHVPWTLACNLLLHTSCTTGFEARIAQKTALSLVATPNWISQSMISNQLNPVFHDPHAFAAAAADYLEHGTAPPPPAMDDATFAYYVWNFADKDATHRLASLLTRDLPKPREPVMLPPLMPYNRGETQKKKFTMTPAEFSDVFNRIFAIIGPSPRPLDYRLIGDSLFYVRPAETVR